MSRKFYKCQFCKTEADFIDYFIQNGLCDFCKEEKVTCVDCYEKNNKNLKPKCDFCKKQACCMNELCRSMVSKFLETTLHDEEVICTECQKTRNYETYNRLAIENKVFEDYWCERCHKYMCGCCYQEKCKVCKRRICEVCITQNNNQLICLECN